MFSFRSQTDESPPHESTRLRCRCGLFCVWAHRTVGTISVARSLRRSAFHRTNRRSGSATIRNLLFRRSLVISQQCQYALRLPFSNRRTSGLLCSSNSFLRISWFIRSFHLVERGRVYCEGLAPSQRLPRQHASARLAATLYC